MPNPVVYFEIGCRDSAKTKSFYAGVFGWTVNPELHIDTGGEGIGGHIASLGHEPHQYTLFYIQVDDIPAYLAKVEAAGGKKIVGPVPIPGKGAFAWFSDPGGNTVGLWTSAPK